MNYLWPEGGLEQDIDPAVMARRLAPVPPFSLQGRKAAELCLENILVLGAVILAHLGIMIFLLALMGMVMKIFGSLWIGLVFGLVVLILFLGPALRMINSHLALNIWDESSGSPLDSVFFVKSLYFKSLFTYLWSIYYELDLWARAVPSLWPGLLTAGILHALLHFFTDVDDLFFWDALVVIVITSPLALSRLWGRIRRVQFLYFFNAFEVVDGKSNFAEDLSEEQPGYWRGRFARLFFRLDDDWWRVPLGRAAWLWLAKSLVWGLPSALILISGMTLMAKLYLIVVFGLTLRYALNLWFGVAAAGWFRENLSSGRYY